MWLRDSHSWNAIVPFNPQAKITFRQTRGRRADQKDHLWHHAECIKDFWGLILIFLVNDSWWKNSSELFLAAAATWVNTKVHQIKRLHPWALSIYLIHTFNTTAVIFLFHCLTVIYWQEEGGSGLLSYPAEWRKLLTQAGSPDSVQPPWHKPWLSQSATSTSPGTRRRLCQSRPSKPVELGREKKRIRRSNWVNFSVHPRLPQIKLIKLEEGQNIRWLMTNPKILSNVVHQFKDNENWKACSVFILVLFTGR